jgi:hypothetical protein
LKGYTRIREDFQAYVATTIPHIAAYPAPETFIKRVVPKLRAFGLAKTEVFTILNLGIGLPKAQQQQDNTSGEAEVNGDGDVPADDEEQAQPAEETSEGTPDVDLLSCAVHNLYERFPGDEGQEQIQKIIDTMKEEYEQALAKEAHTNGDTHPEADAMDQS